MSQALAKTEPQVLLAQVRTDPVTAITQQYDQLAQMANVTFPPTALDNLPPMHKPSPSVIRVDTGQQSKDTYTITREQLGLSKHTILKMLTAAGCSWRTRKLTPDNDLDNIRWMAEVWRRLPDGAFQTGQGSKAWNWSRCQEDFTRKAVEKPRDNETPEQSRARGMKSAQQYREFADEQTESKALLRAARAILNIKTSYSPAELAKPFLFLRVVPDLDMSDPEIKRMTAQKLIDSTFAIYGQAEAAPQLPPPAIADFPAEPTEAEFQEDDEPAAGPVDSVRNEEAEADPNYDPFKEEAAAQPQPAGGDIEAEIDAAIAATAKRVPRGKFRELLEKHGLASLTSASFDQRVAFLEDLKIIAAGGQS